MTTLMWEVAACGEVDEVTTWLAAELWPWLTGTRGYVDAAVHASAGRAPQSGLC